VKLYFSMQHSVSPPCRYVAPPRTTQVNMARWVGAETEWQGGEVPQPGTVDPSKRYRVHYRYSGVADRVIVDKVEDRPKTVYDPRAKGMKRARRRRWREGIPDRHLRDVFLVGGMIDGLVDGKIQSDKLDRPPTRREDEDPRGAELARCAAADVRDALAVATGQDQDPGDSFHQIRSQKRKKRRARKIYFGGDKRCPLYRYSAVGRYSKRWKWMIAEGWLYTTWMAADPDVVVSLRVRSLRLSGFLVQTQTPAGFFVDRPGSGDPAKLRWPSSSKSTSRTAPSPSASKLRGKSTKPNFLGVFVVRTTSP
jgi:hypothetical protein